MTNIYSLVFTVYLVCHKVTLAHQGTNYMAFNAYQFASLCSFIKSKSFNHLYNIFYFQFSPLIQDTVLKGTFNATLNNPITPQIESVHNAGTAKHAFLLGVWDFLFMQTFIKIYIIIYFMSQNKFSGIWWKCGNKNLHELSWNFLRCKLLDTDEKQDCGIWSVLSNFKFDLFFNQIIYGVKWFV